MNIFMYECCVQVATEVRIVHRSKLRKMEE
jgi:hypothetical protein